MESVCEHNHTPRSTSLDPNPAPEGVIRKTTINDCIIVKGKSRAQVVFARSRKVPPILHVRHAPRPPRG
jgi:hypothetical protein